MTPALALRRPVWPMLVAAFIGGAAVLAAFFPAAISVAAVFVFAGPHNWFEARYFAARMPVRWTGQRGFFVAALAGIAGLSATFSVIPVDRSLWHAALVCWLLCLVQFSRRRMTAVQLASGLAWIAFACLFPEYADLALVYLHPVAALWFVHRQVAKSRPEWMPQVRTMAAALPLLALFIIAARAGQPSINALQFASFAPLANSSALVALHAFLELLHYGAWVVLLPMIGLATSPWDLRTIPLVRHRLGWPKAVSAVLAAGAVLVLLLWVLFLLDFSTTRSIYFSVAIVHVLAEVPFLLWLR